MPHFNLLDQSLFFSHRAVLEEQNEEETRIYTLTSGRQSSWTGVSHSGSWVFMITSVRPISCKDPSVDSHMMRAKGSDLDIL
jgi:hypothetical protein